jgi:ATP-dependent Lhr-like helicase
LGIQSPIGRERNNLSLTTTNAFELLSSDVRKIAAELGLDRETAIQKEAIPAILSGENVLLIAPTGSGKTEAALLPILEKMNADVGISKGIRALYVTPLRALNRDMLRRLEYWASGLNLSVEVRHGDTSQKARRSQSLHPPDILITTPETLQAILIGSRLRQALRSVRWVVIDEIHQLASDRRGAQLSIALERLAALVGPSLPSPFQRIGISATIGNPEDVSRFLCGVDRPCRIVDATASTEKVAEYTVELPEPTPEDEIKSREIFVTPQTMSRMQRIADLVAGHAATLIFVNSRTNAETLSSRFGMLGVKVGVHHGSLPREERERVENDFKAGRIKALICTSTLELGIDIGSVDLSIQYMSPRQVNSLVQRVGRSGHSLSKKSEGIILSVAPEDALEAVVLSQEARERNLEPVYIHECPLDVLAHQVAGVLLESSDASAELEAMLSLFRRASPFKSLTKDQIVSVLTYMEKLGYLRRDERGRVFRRSKCREYYVSNLSMIPDERRYNVIDLSTQQKVGILGEEFMLLHAKVGVHFIIKGKIWQIESIQGENVYVSPFEDLTAAVPGWDGELLPTPERVAFLVGRERGKIDQLLESREEASSTTAVIESTRLTWQAERSARSKIILEIEEQKRSAAVPSDKKVVVERYGRFLIIHTSLGDRINQTLGELFEEILLRDGLIRNWWNDGYRILLELATEEFETKEIAMKLFHYGQGTEGFLNAVIRKHFPFGYYMKFIAERFGALERGLMLSGEALRELVFKFRFTPIYEETLREALATKVDLPGSLRLLSSCASGIVELAIIESPEKPSPLARYILNHYADYEEEVSPGNSVESMKAAIANEIVNLLCFECANLVEYAKISNLGERPVCASCGSSLLAVLFYGARFIKNCLERKKAGVAISEQEASALSKARRSADLVLSYGKRGAIAQCVYGVGPQTAYKVLSKMHESEELFYNDLVQAKLKFIETKPYWD